MILVSYSFFTCVHAPPPLCPRFIPEHFISIDLSTISTHTRYQPCLSKSGFQAHALQFEWDQKYWTLKNENVSYKSKMVISNVLSDFTRPPYRGQLLKFLFD